MEQNAINLQPKIKIKASELLSKFRHKEDRYNFCREKNFYFPNEIYFDSTFFLQWLTGVKKLLPLGKHGDYKMPYFRNEGVLTKKFIIGIIKGKPKYLPYLPDKAKLENLTKDFLFSLIAYLEPEVYRKMYELYKTKTAESATQKWDDYSINIAQDIANDIKNFIPVKSHIGNLKPFRLTKNHEDTDIFVNSKRNGEDNDGNGDGEMGE